MNALDLPPREHLRPETRARLRDAVQAGIADPERRSRAPLTAAACVVAFAVAAVLTGSALRDDRPTSREAAGLVATTPGSQTKADLDRCGELVPPHAEGQEFGPGDGYTPRSTWRPRFTTTAPDGTRITAFRDEYERPGFCAVTATTVSVSVLHEGLVVANGAASGRNDLVVDAILVTPTGLLAGASQGEDLERLDFSVFADGRSRPTALPAFQDGLFVVDIGAVDVGVEVAGRDVQGKELLRGLIIDSPRVLLEGVASERR